MSNRRRWIQQWSTFAVTLAVGDQATCRVRRKAEAKRTAPGRQRVNRRLGAERFEGRALMAVDVNPWPNELVSTDVDGDMQLSPSDTLGVINQLGGEGEPVVVRFAMTTTNLTGSAMSEFYVGDHFLLQTTVQDTRSLPSGVFAAYLDIVYSSQFRPVIRETQRIQVTGNPDGGTLRLVFGGQQSEAITYDPLNSLSTANGIKTALEGLSNVDPGEIEVFDGPNVGTSWDVRFGGKRYGNTNVANMTTTAMFNGGASPAVSIIEVPGSVPGGVGETNNIVRSTTYGNKYPNGRSARDGEGSDPNVLNEIGAFSMLTPLGGGEQQLFTVEFEAVAPGTGSFTSNPADDTPSHDVILFLVNGAVADTDIAYPAINITIAQPANAVADHASATEDQTTSTRIPVLANDTISSGTKQIQSFTQPAGGTVVRFAIDNTNPAGDQLDYTPNADFFGTDTFTYVLSDGNGNTSTATVSVDVASVNDPPIANSDAAATIRNTGVNVDVLSNDTDVDGTLNQASVQITSAAAHGAVTVLANGTIDYVPNGDYQGSDSFQYTVRDDVGEVSNAANVSLTVGPPPPLWQNQDIHRDVDHDGSVSSVDALLIINRLNLGESGILPVPAPVPPPPFYDVDGDGSVTSKDALLVINFLNGLGDGEGEGNDDVFKAIDAAFADNWLADESGAWLLTSSWRRALRYASHSGRSSMMAPNSRMTTPLISFSTRPPRSCSL